MYYQSFIVIVALAVNAIAALPSPRRRDPLQKRGWEFATIGKDVNCTPYQQGVINKVLEDANELLIFAAAADRTDLAFKAFFDPNSNIDIWARVNQRYQKMRKFLDSRTREDFEAVQFYCPTDGFFDTCKGNIAFAIPAVDGYPASVTFCPKFWNGVEDKALGTSLQVQLTHTTTVDYDFCKHPEELQYADFPAATLIHELSHLSVISKPKNSQAGGPQPHTIDCVYGAYYSEFLALNDPNVPERNAENYGLMAVSKYMSEMCGMPDVMFHQPARDKYTALEQPMGIEKGKYHLCKLPMPAAANLPHPVDMDLMLS